jgi:hypothetical protein
MTIRKGITLIEMIATVAFLALLMTISAKHIQRGVKTIPAIRHDIETHGIFQHMLVCLRNDIELAQAITHQSPIGYEDPNCLALTMADADVYYVLEPSAVCWLRYEHDKPTDKQEAQWKVPHGRVQWHIHSGKQEFVEVVTYIQRRDRKRLKNAHVFYTATSRRIEP